MKLNRPAHRAIGAVSAVLASASLLVACGDSAGTDGTESIEVSTSVTPEANPETIDPIDADSLTGKTVDPGLNVEMTYQGLNSGTGSVITVMVKNLNDEPLPADALGNATLTYNSGGGTMVDAEPLTAGEAGITVGLDKPLGAQATSNLFYPFDVSPGNLWDAELQVGNIVWEGNLNF